MAPVEPPHKAEGEIRRIMGNASPAADRFPLGGHGRWASANPLFAATGRRLHRLPSRLDEVAAAGEPVVPPLLLSLAVIVDWPPRGCGKPNDASPDEGPPASARVALSSG
jgi:hypothetical protein